MILAQSSVMHEIVDLPVVRVRLWGVDFTVFSADIASMLLAAALVVLLVVPATRRWPAVPRGWRNVLEVLVIFVRDMIAKPALHNRACMFVPYLATMFMFVLAMNLLGLLPLRQISSLLGMPLGGTATGILAVCGGLAALSLATIAGLALRRQTLKYHRQKGWPVVLAAALSPLLWVAAFAPPIRGIAGVILIVPLMLLEFIGVLAKCFALMIRLFANMISGHTLLAVLAMLGIQTLADNIGRNIVLGASVSVVCVAGSVVMAVMELLVAAIQAYVFTFLTAIYIGLYVDPAATH